MTGPVSVRMDQQLLEAIDAEAAADHRTRAQVIRVAVADYLARQHEQREHDVAREVRAAS